MYIKVLRVVYFITDIDKTLMSNEFMKKFDYIFLIIK